MAEAKDTPVAERKDTPVAEREGKAGKPKNTAVAVKDTAKTAMKKALAIWKTQRGKRPWLDHAVRAYQQLNNTNGSLMAGALTFISFLSLVPLLVLAVSVSAAVLKSHPHTLQTVLDKIEAQAPGGLGDALKSAVHVAVDNSGKLGAAGLVSVAMTGLSWVSDLRTATEQVWEHPPLHRNYVKGKIADLFLLAGLGAGLGVSVGLTVAGSALTGPLIHLLSFGGSAVVTVLTRVVGIAVSALTATLVLGFLLIRLPRAKVPRGTGIRAAVMAGIGLECLNLSGTYYIKSVSKSPTVAAFGGLVGVLVFLNLVFRFLLYCTAWTATGTPNDPLAASDEVPTFHSGANKTADVSGANKTADVSGADKTADVEAPQAARPPPAVSGGSQHPGRPEHSRGVATALAMGALAHNRKRKR